MHAGFLLGKMKERGHLADLGLGGRKTLKLILARRDEKMWPGITSLRTGTWQDLVDMDLEL
jgi:hypothetical protein